MFLQWYRYCFSKYFTFQGRASRAEYWSFTIINLLILWVFWFISKLVDVPEDAMAQGIPVFPKDPVLALIFGSLYLILCRDFLSVSYRDGSAPARPKSQRVLGDRSADTASEPRGFTDAALAFLSVPELLWTSRTAVPRRESSGTRN